MGIYQRPASKRRQGIIFDFIENNKDFKKNKIMTREEEILNAARERAGRHQIAERELNKYSSQLYDGIYSSEILSFEAGAKWTDEHPKNIWHDVSEEPEGNYWRILCQDEMNGCWVENRVDAMLLHNTWNEYAAIEMVDKWAYISDLLPKGGGE